MDEKYILCYGEGEEKREYLIGNIIEYGSDKYFMIINLISADVMFGEFLGELPEDEDEAREIIWKDFMNGCKHIQYPDGYIVDDLYEMMEL